MHVSHMRSASSECVLIILVAVLLPITSLGFTAITLTSQDFESKTQAATGQTTGIWYVVPRIVVLLLLSVLRQTMKMSCWAYPHNHVSPGLSSSHLLGSPACST